MIILCALFTSNILISFDHLLSNLWQSLQLTSANLFPSALQLALYTTFSLSIFMFPCFHSFQNLNFLLTLLLQSSLFGGTFCPSKSPTHSLFPPFCQGETNFWKNNCTPWGLKIWYAFISICVTISAKHYLL